MTMPTLPEGYFFFRMNIFCNRVTLKWVTQNYKMLFINALQNQCFLSDEVRCLQLPAVTNRGGSVAGRLFLLGYRKNWSEVII